MGGVYLSPIYKITYTLLTYFRNIVSKVTNFSFYYFFFFLMVDILIINWIIKTLAAGDEY